MPKCFELSAVAKKRSPLLLTEELLKSATFEPSSTGTPANRRGTQSLVTV